MENKQKTQIELKGSGRAQIGNIPVGIIRKLAAASTYNEVYDILVDINNKLIDKENKTKEQAEERESIENCEVI